MSGKIRPSLLRTVLQEMDSMERMAHPPIGKAKRDCIRMLVKKELEQKQGEFEIEVE